MLCSKVNSLLLLDSAEIDVAMDVATDVVMDVVADSMSIASGASFPIWTLWENAPDVDGI